MSNKVKFTLIGICLLAFIGMFVGMMSYMDMFGVPLIAWTAIAVIVLIALVIARYSYRMLFEAGEDDGRSVEAPGKSDEDEETMSDRY